MMSTAQKNTNKPLSALTRTERRNRRYKPCLRCEWCGMWIEVANKKWEEEIAKPEGYTYICSRSRCLFHRPETWDTHKPSPWRESKSRGLI